MARNKQEKKVFHNGGFYNYRPPFNGKKKPYFTLNFLRAIVRPFFKKPKVEFKTEIPNEPVMYVCNHTKIYAPTAIVLYFRNIRMWANLYFMDYKQCWHHMKTKVLKDRKQFLPFIAMILPLVVVAFRQMEHIPVYRDTKVRETFLEASECLESGRSCMVFAEQYDGELVNKYIYNLQWGYLYSAQKYFQRTGKKLKIYPVYCSESLKTFLVGEPVEFDPDRSVKEQSAEINKHLEKTIGELGDSLPEHKIVLYK